MSESVGDNISEALGDFVGISKLPRESHVFRISYCEPIRFPMAEHRSWLSKRWDL
jgi:hypothetical protein